MVDASLEHTRVEVVSGTAMVESDDPQMSVKNAPVTIVSGQTEIRIVKHGLVEIGADDQKVKVYRGEAEVTEGSNHVMLKEGSYVPLTGDLKAEKFDSKAADDLFIWSRDRSVDLSAANAYLPALWAAELATVGILMHRRGAVDGITTISWICTATCRPRGCYLVLSVTAFTAPMPSTAWVEHI